MCLSLVLSLISVLADMVLFFNNQRLFSSSTYLRPFCGLLVLQITVIFPSSGERLCSPGLLQRVNVTGDTKCCLPVYCATDYFVRFCSENNKRDVCEKCPHGTTLAYASSSYNPRQCYQKPQGCSVESMVALNSSLSSCECSREKGLYTVDPEIPAPDSDWKTGVECQPMPVKTCPVGTQPRNMICEKCPKGFYKDKSGFALCKQKKNCTMIGQRVKMYEENETVDTVCEEVNETTKTTVLDVVCHDGYERVNNFCQKCAKGYYRNSTENKASLCQICPGNSTTQRKGAKSLEECISSTPEVSLSVPKDIVTPRIEESRKKKPKGLPLWSIILIAVGGVAVVLIVVVVICRRTKNKCSSGCCTSSQNIEIGHQPFADKVDYSSDNVTLKFQNGNCILNGTAKHEDKENGHAVSNQCPDESRSSGIKRRSDDSGVPPTYTESVEVSEGDSYGQEENYPLLGAARGTSSRQSYLNDDPSSNMSYTGPVSSVETFEGNNTQREDRESLHIDRHLDSEKVSLGSCRSDGQNSEKKADRFTTIPNFQPVEPDDEFEKLTVCLPEKMPSSEHTDDLEQTKKMAVRLPAGKNQEGEDSEQTEVLKLDTSRFSHPPVERVDQQVEEIPKNDNLSQKPERHRSRSENQTRPKPRPLPVRAISVTPDKQCAVVKAVQLGETAQPQVAEANHGQVNEGLHVSFPSLPSSLVNNHNNQMDEHSEENEVQESEEESEPEDKHATFAMHKN